MGNRVNNGGWVLLYRSLKHRSWYRNPAARSVAIHALLTANYMPVEDKRYGRLERGQFADSVRGLAEFLGLSRQCMRTAIRILEEDGFIETKSTDRYVVFTVQNWDKYQMVADDDIMLNSPIANPTANPVGSPTVNPNPDKVTTSVSIDYERKKKLPTQQPTQQPTQSATQYPTHNINKDIKNTGNNTHYSPVETKEGVVGGDSAVAQLAEWISTECPKVWSMSIPFTAPELADLVSRYRIEDIKRIIADMEDLRVDLRRRKAYTAFGVFADNDRILRETRNLNKLYTFGEMRDLVDRQRALEKDFETVRLDDVTRWRIKGRVNHET